ncbi:hypothetical protein C2S51_008789 [Perilla frutescens var. frutescens]|nr:hypothetical protein C2S51_008789 [Perilla frutescens var. frutescens]
MWTTHATFISTISDSWKGNVDSRSAMRIVMIKLKRLKKVLKEWNTAVFGNYNNKIGDLQRNLADVQEEISLHGYSDKRLDDEINTQEELNGELVADPERIAAHVISYYEKLFTSSDNASMDYALVDQIIPKLIMEQQCHDLTIPPLFEEVKIVVFNLDANSAAGPNGFSGKKFQVAWDVIALDIYRAVV